MKLKWEKNKSEELKFSINKTVIAIEVFDRWEGKGTEWSLEGISFQLNGGVWAYVMD